MRICLLHALCRVEERGPERDYDIDQENQIDESVDSIDGVAFQGGVLRVLVEYFKWDLDRVVDGHQDHKDVPVFDELTTAREEQLTAKVLVFLRA